MTISLKKIIMFRILFILVKQAEEKEKSFDLTMEMRKVKKHHKRRRRRRLHIREFGCQNNPQSTKAGEDGH